MNITWQPPETASQGGGRKDDHAKPRVDLLPPDALLSVANVLTHGAAKYGVRNWERGITHGRLYAAAVRHLLAWQSSEDADPDSGQPHLAHAACSVLMLLALSLRAVGEDDRPSAHLTIANTMGESA